MPIMWAPADPKIGEREVVAAMLEVDAESVARREGILLITDKGFRLEDVRAGARRVWHRVTATLAQA
ncbi:hypothetical protein [Kitasatospora sp. NPDC088783]|uniref:hypothetical protein n=1 Tax=Kitasatospora sp. NPDC088783 TaxID=3364077 RepID=UPI00382373EA